MLENYDKDYLKKVFLRVAGTALGLLMIAYIGYQIWHKVTSNVKCIPATPYTYTLKSTGEGYVFRSETVIESPGAGAVVAGVRAGEKVSAYSEVANLYSSGSADVEQKLADIDEQIALLTASSDTENLTNRDVLKLDSETYALITEMRRCAEQGRFAEAVSHKLNLITKVNRRNAASGTGGDLAAKVSELERERAELTSALGTLLSVIKTPCSGWYYPDTDGYEALFSSDNVGSMTYDDFKALVSSNAADTSRDAGKTVTSSVWYFACELPKSSLDTKVVGEEYTVFFPHNRGAKIVMTLEKTCPGGDTGIAVFKTDKNPDGFDFARMQSYELLENEYTGFKVPKSAVRVIDGQMGVYVLTGEVVHFRKIEVMTEYESNYIVVMDHEETPEAETEANEDNDGVAQSPEWSPDDASQNTGAATTDTASGESAAEPEEYKWLEVNENIIVSGKGLSDGRVITNMN